MSETLFKEVKYELGALIRYIELGEIGLPDIQRPFVWKNAKVRDLFDSMYRGYPVGYLLFWQNSFSGDTNPIGVNQKQKPAQLLIVDGQQRLTSLYAVLQGIPVVRENYEKELIEIAFNPIEERFEVADAAIKKDKTFIQDISVVWNGSTNLFALRDAYLDDLREAREITSDQERSIENAIMKLKNLETFPFTALELSAAIDEEQVGDVFVRINSKGTPLNQADFILTLMSVFWDEGRTDLEAFCRAARVPSSGKPNPFNFFITPKPDQLLRVSVGVAFKRARLNYVYSILRGKDLETEEFSEERRVEQFARLKEAQERTLNLQLWHDFLKVLGTAGFRNGKMISSQNNVLFTYILYLIGRTEYGIEEHLLRRTLARWFFMASLTGRFTSSPESAMEFDLARLRGVKCGDEFVGILTQVCAETLTKDYWEITLPGQLATSSGRSPSLFAYYASLVLLDAKVLFSERTVSDLLMPGIHANKSAIERHHLFPKGHLASLGIKEIRETNQIANFALLEWGDNVGISSKSPAEYLATYHEFFTSEQLFEMYRWHALPDQWEKMDYSAFLKQRRELIAKVIRDAYLSLDSNEVEVTETVDFDSLVASGESDEVEFKATLRKNLHTEEHDKRMEFAVIRTVAGFLNGNGGTLVVGVSDSGQAVGIDEDGFANEDKMNLHFANLIRDRISPTAMLYVQTRFDDYKGRRAFTVRVQPANQPAYVKDGSEERIFVRVGPSTSELTVSQAMSYCETRFG